VRRRERRVWRGFGCLGRGMGWRLGGPEWDEGLRGYPGCKRLEKDGLEGGAAC
jgi:hypothetical protein